MELFQGLFFTVVVTILIAIVVVRGMSMIILVYFGCDSSRNVASETVMNEVKRFDEGFSRVERSRSKRRVKFVEGFVKTVHQFEDDRAEVHVHVQEKEKEKEKEKGEVLVLEERCDSAEMCADVAGLSDKSPEVGFVTEEVPRGVVCEDGLQGVNEANVGGVDGLVGQSTDVVADEFDRPTGLDGLINVVADGSTNDSKDQNIVFDGLIAEDINLKSAESASCNVVTDEFSGVKDQYIVLTGSDGLVVDRVIVKSAESASDNIVVTDEFNGDENIVSTGLDVGEILIKSTKSASGEAVADQSEENQGSGVEVGESQEEEDKEELGCEEEEDDDDWEGIERSELEKVFAVAANYVDNGSLENVGSDVQMQLYGFHKVGMEGPCREPQPMALKLTARAKWY